VLVLPGYGGADGSTAILRHLLKPIGYCPYALNLGRNLESSAERIKSVDDATRFRNNMTDAVIDRVESIYEQTGQPVSLLGWSMDGLYALDASHRLPTKKNREPLDPIDKPMLLPGTSQLPSYAKKSEGPAPLPPGIFT
jgi:pimeloyl-ACP methyl ester carboxylesterase